MAWHGMAWHGMAAWCVRPAGRGHAACLVRRAWSAKPVELQERRLPLLVQLWLCVVRACRTWTSRRTSSTSVGVMSFRLEMVLHAYWLPVDFSATSRVVPNCPFPSTLPKAYSPLMSAVSAKTQSAGATAVCNDQAIKGWG
jgi:hypothetical protein